MSTDEQFLEETLAMAYDEGLRVKLIEGGVLPRLQRYLSEERYCVNSLEILFLLSIHPSNQKVMATTEGLATTIKKLTVRGRLKQKKVALATFKNLQPFVTELPSEFSEFSSVEDQENNPQNSKKPNPMAGFAKRSTLKSANSTPNTSYSLFVENMNNQATQKAVEACLLNTPGVVSFMCDATEGKVTVRTSGTQEDLAAAIFKDTKLRSSTVKGQFDDFKPSGYPSQEETDTGWGSYLWQIISVGPNGAPLKQKQSQQNPERSWLGWW